MAFLSAIGSERGRHAGLVATCTSCPVWRECLTAARTTADAGISLMSMWGGVYLETHGGRREAWAVLAAMADRHQGT
jgi:hypothetical protein